GPVVARDWSARTLGGDPAPATLVDGEAPGPGEVVVDEQTAREAGVTVGDPLPLAAPGGAVELRVSGIVAGRAATATDGASGWQPTAWLADGVTAELVGQSGQADAIAVFVDDGADVTAVRSEVREVIAVAAPEAELEVRTGAARGEIEVPDLPNAKELLIGF